jgi:hypothetical protein
MNKDLFLAILAMDSYNRGYGTHLTGLSSTRGTLVGNAEIGLESNVIRTSPEFAAENGDMMRIKSINEYFSID